MATGLQRTTTELKAAMETMYRVRAVESPPDEQGARIIWHRGARGADLVSTVGADGKVTRQELFLFEDYFLYERAAGLRTGVALDKVGAAGARASGDIAFDQDAVLKRKRIEQAARALAGYQGPDALIGHARQVMAAAAQGKPLGGDAAAARAGAGVKLGEVLAASQELQRRELEARLALRKRNVLLVVGALLLAAGTLAVWWAVR
ncbi:MAG: hypothetical protein IPJ65_33520 [Archangiaceae bacterium]|nr:hypothetical protein [Archangiaceae bacterium]